MVYNVLKVAWSRYGEDEMTELDDRTMAFDFQSEKELRQVMDMSPWSVQGHCLNLIASSEFGSLEEEAFGKLQLWIQIFGLSLDMHNSENGMNIENSIGKCISVEEDRIARNRTFMRLKVELDVMVPLTEGFWWTDKSGEEKWANVKYERLSDVCYGCGRIGHASANCREGVTMSETQPDAPRFGPWMTATRPRGHVRTFKIGGADNPLPAKRPSDRPSWKEVMQKASGLSNPAESRGGLYVPPSARSIRRAPSQDRSVN